MGKVDSVREIKLLLDKVILPNYHYKTNFSSAEFLIDIDSRFIIMAKPICSDNEFNYEFVLDTQFLYEKEITYKELLMIKSVIDILEENKNFVLSRLKKYTVEEYKEELRIRNERSEKMLGALQSMILNQRK